ncbi:carbamate kinase [Mesoplasma photuris]|uniref:carbamate kinase n=1 Tax=Mesoplasma photuris TaxID=217731 RepID=UPI0004E0DE62|nr:carbamate kinase [Mesoplasma photuris]
MSKIVIAIGGNALGNNPNEQKEIVKETAKKLVDSVAMGNQIVIVHGNGPQVGMINNGFGDANKFDATFPLIDFPECGAMSQGYIGYHLQQAINNELRKRKMDIECLSIVTQTLVDKNDPAFKNPTKPVGTFLDEKTAKTMAKENNWEVREDAGRGWRRVVASPEPLDIIEKKSIINAIDQNYITICCGGGGVPVIEDNKNLVGVAGVIDKDFAASKLAEIIKADALIILTAVDRIFINYNKPEQKSLESMTLNEAQKYIEQKHFAPGSMLPKVQAAMRFVEHTNGKTAFIGSLEKISEVLEGKSGTKVTK